jgi:hypothetical protein
MKFNYKNCIDLRTDYANNINAGVLCSPTTFYASKLFLRFCTLFSEFLAEDGVSVTTTDPYIYGRGAQSSREADHIQRYMLHWLGAFKCHYCNDLKTENYNKNCLNLPY